MNEKIKNIDSVGKIIKIRRTELGMTQQQLSKACGIKQQYLSLIENSMICVGVEMLLNILHVLELDLCVCNYAIR